MTAIPVPAALLERLLGVLADNLSKTGHALQFVAWESRGSCPPTGHTERCAEYRALFMEVDALCQVIEAEGIPAT